MIWALKGYNCWKIFFVDPLDREWTKSCKVIRRFYTTRFKQFLWKNGENPLKNFCYCGVQHIRYLLYTIETSMNYHRKTRRFWNIDLKTCGVCIFWVSSQHMQRWTKNITCTATCSQQMKWSCLCYTAMRLPTSYLQIIILVSDGREPAL